MPDTDRKTTAARRRALAKIAKYTALIQAHPDNLARRVDAYVEARDLGLQWTEMAEVAGVTPEAISQQVKKRVDGA